jgi:hypothetical protein
MPPFCHGEHEVVPQVDGTLGRMFRRATALAAALFLTAGASRAALAQDTPTVPPPSAANAPSSEDVEPRVVGGPGTMTVGFSGYADRFFSTDKYLPTTYAFEVDVQRFLTKHFVARGGVVGAGSTGGEDADQGASGTGMSALYAGGGVLYYLTPKSIASLYGGLEYWAQVTNRGDAGDRGTALGKVGWEAALSSRASFFVEAGAGVGLTRASDNSALTRFQGRVGLHIKL